MRSRFLVLVWLAVAGLFSPALAFGAPAAPAAELFDDQVLHDVRLFISSRDWRMIRERYEENIRVPADFIWRDQRVRNVGVRIRGTGSRTPIKPGLDLEFGYYTRGQQFLGLKGLVLDNLWQDPSLLRESLAMAVFRRMGAAAPRESFARLFVNNEFQGVYAIIEPIDTRFAAEAVGQADGRLFEYRYVMPFYGEYLGEEFDPYKRLFEPRGQATDTDAMLYGPIRDLVRTFNEEDDATWRERADAYLDLPQVMAHVAIQGYLGDNDGFMGYAGLNNFYLYRYPGTTKHRVFPWDEDFAFTFIDASVLRRGEQPVTFFERAWTQPDLRTYFLDTVEACARLMDEDAWLQNEVERVVSLVGPSILADPLKPFSNDEFAAEVEFLRRFAQTRGAYVLGEIASLREGAR